MLAHDADVNLCPQNDKNNTPLNLATANGNFDIVQLLLAHHAELNPRNDDCPSNKTPLWSAVQVDHIEMVQTLLSHGASPNKYVTIREHDRSQGQVCSTQCAIM